MTSVRTTAFEVGALPGLNGALAFGVSNTGYVVGSSMLNQGSGSAVHLVGSRRNGCHPTCVRHKSGLGARGEFSRLGGGKRFVSVLDSVSLRRNKHLSACRSHTSEPGWDLSMNTSSSADGISEQGVIVGTGVHNGETHAYAMVPVAPSPTPTPTPTATAHRDLRRLRQELLLHQGRARVRDRDRSP